MQQTAAPRRTVSLEEVAADSSAGTLAEARALLLEYGQFILATDQVAGFCFGSLEQEAARIPLNYTERGGGCLIARADGVAAGFVCWRDISSNAIPCPWEMKRLWVRPEARGLGLGRTLTQAVLDRAAHAKRRAVYLDTVPAAMADAHRLYLVMGFTPCPQYNDSPIAGIEYLEKLL
ncbi:GNAT family N-acetyltransferase [Terracidiphilus gabretensis]|uniref:GNAT family N-acetyltransferase n=1 Tax=Terracidiphilus gabretensis TaxID=1577687 RepID=UPI0012FC5486|nr:GNAT family N-acetyltransferase [Terracidiphilus gabretensis]